MVYSYYERNKVIVLWCCVIIKIKKDIVVLRYNKDLFLTLHCGEEGLMAESRYTHTNNNMGAFIIHHLSSHHPALSYCG